MTDTRSALKIRKDVVAMTNEQKPTFLTRKVGNPPYDLYSVYDRSGKVVFCGTNLRQARAALTKAKRETP